MITLRAFLISVRINVFFNICACFKALQWKQILEKRQSRAVAKLTTVGNCECLPETFVRGLRLECHYETRAPEIC